MGHGAEFDGAKVALFIGEKLIVILRDDMPDLPFAGHWDLPGGGREGRESPFSCVARECDEELGLGLSPRDVVWQARFDRGGPTNTTVWFFVACLPEDAVKVVRFGDEGRRWTLMSPRAFLAHPKAVPAFQTRLKIWCDQRMR